MYCVSCMCPECIMYDMLYYLLCSMHVSWMYHVWYAVLCIVYHASILNVSCVICCTICCVSCKYPECIMYKNAHLSPIKHHNTISALTWDSVTTIKIPLKLCHKHSLEYNCKIDKLVSSTGTSLYTWYHIRLSLIIIIIMFWWQIFVTSDGN